jgi:hypothetical protein
MEAPHGTPRQRSTWVLAAFRTWVPVSLPLMNPPPPPWQGPADTRFGTPEKDKRTPMPRPTPTCTHAPNRGYVLLHGTIVVLVLVLAVAVHAVNVHDVGHIVVAGEGTHARPIVMHTVHALSQTNHTQNPMQAHACPQTHKNQAHDQGNTRASSGMTIRGQRCSENHTPRIRHADGNVKGLDLKQALQFRGGVLLHQLGHLQARSHAPRRPAPTPNEPRPRPTHTRTHTHPHAHTHTITQSNRHEAELRSASALQPTSLRTRAEQQSHTQHAARA